MVLLSQQEIKKALGKKAAELVQEGMLVGLGTGSTAICFIDSLIERCRKGLRIQVVSSSLRSLEQARKGNIPIADMDHITSIDLTVDGADEIDSKNRMIKGGGGALFREKILATSSREVAILVDESKVVSQLGKRGLPIEILPFGYSAILFKLKQAGFDGHLRLREDQSLYVTDNGNYIFDISTPKIFTYPEKDQELISSIPGVLETGFFFDLATKVLIGYADGTIECRTKYTQMS